jgi:nitrilase
MMNDQQDQNDLLTIGIAQIAPVWLNREATTEKIMKYIDIAADQDCNLVVFGEGLLPGYPFWIERTNGAIFNSPIQKEFFAHYLSNAVQIEAGHLDEIRELALQNNLAVMLGCIERPDDRGGHSVYASLVYIASDGEIKSVHRKLVPTYEERLAWSPGDGHGLRTHRLGAFTLGGLNCWENWLPLARAALYGQGEDLHVAVWPGGIHNTKDITRFIAQEARSYVVSVSGLMHFEDIPDETPHKQAIISEASDTFANGGSCIAGPDGSWLVEPIIDEEILFVATIDYQNIREERHNFDPAGHYSRPDVLQLSINRQRQNTLIISD